MNVKLGKKQLDPVIAEVNRIIESIRGVWPMADSELCLERGG